MTRPSARRSAQAEPTAAPAMEFRGLRSKPAEEQREPAAAEPVEAELQAEAVATIDEGEDDSDAASESPELQRMIEDARRKALEAAEPAPAGETWRGSAALQRLRDARKDPASDALPPAERVAREQQRLVDRAKQASDARAVYDGAGESLQRINAQITAERARLDEFNAKVKAAALTGKALPDASASKLPALEAARDDIASKLEQARADYEAAERLARDKTWLRLAQRSFAVEQAGELAKSKVASAVAELRAVLSSAPGEHVYSFTDAKLTVTVLDAPPPREPEFSAGTPSAGSNALQKLRSLRAQKEAAE